MRSLKTYLFLLFLSFSALAVGQSKEKEPGTLLILGGAATNPYFISYFGGIAGGLDAKLVLIPTAMTDEAITADPNFERLKAPFEKLGFTSIEVVHTRDRDVADDEALNAKILDADGVWITGGRQWRLAMAYNGTEVVNSLKTILNQGKVIAGTSAGASIMADLMVRGDPSGNTIMLGEYQEGFGLVENIAIDQHHLARNRQFDLFEVKREYPDILGVGLEENTGIFVSDGRFRVVGGGYVAIYDGTRWSAEKDTIYPLAGGEEQFYFLKEGQEYDLDLHKVILPQDRRQEKAEDTFLAPLAGTYQQLEGIEVGNDIRIEVSVNEGKLQFRQSWNKATYDVLQDKGLTFFRPNSNSAFHFERNSKGQIDQFKFVQNSATTWKKL